MYILSINMWFQKLMKQFFFGIDQVVYNAISSIYDLLISIARTSVLSQADILDMADRIYKLLAIFMIFKVTLSLITYVVNPDDFSDKSKGISKLSTNIIISLGMLILTPYIFNMAYRLQTIILEDNTMATLIFGEEDDEENFINTAGDEMAFITMSAFFSPNTSITEFQECINLTLDNGKVNPECSGLSQITYDKDPNITTNTMATLADPDSKNFPLSALQNYVVGVDNKSFGLMFRQEMAVATVEDNTQFVMDYKYIFSTVVGVIIVLLLITFCMDVALRSIKLAFLQLIAPIPILSFVDPKSGKDGMFKKWYQLCFKTYLSLFIRLLALYFAVYIIGKVADMKLIDVADGSYQTHAFVYIFVIIGALMFAKQLPKILEGLGIKLDGDGKFFLNPLKKFEESSAGGKNVTGLARGAMVGTAGALSGNGIGRAFTGAWRGMTSGKGWKETGKAEAEMNRKMRQAKLDGSTFGGRLGARFAGATGMISSSEMIAREKHGVEKEIKMHDDNIKQIEDKKRAIQGSQRYVERKNKIKDRKAFADGIKAMEDRAKGEIGNGNSWVGEEYKIRKKNEDSMSNNIGKEIRKDWSQRDIDYANYRIEKAQKEKETALKQNDMDAFKKAEQREKDATERRDDAVNKLNTSENITVTNEDAAWASSMADDWLNDEGMKAYMSDASSGVIGDATFASARKKTEEAANNLGTKLETDGGKIHTQYGKTKGEINDLEIEGQADERAISRYDDQIADINRQKAPYNDQLRELNDREKKAKANESAIK